MQPFPLTGIIRAVVSTQEWFTVWSGNCGFKGDIFPLYLVFSLPYATFSTAIAYWNTNQCPSNATVLLLAENNALWEDILQQGKRCKAHRESRKLLKVTSKQHKRDLLQKKNYMCINYNVDVRTGYYVMQLYSSFNLIICNTIALLITD